MLKDLKTLGYRIDRIINTGSFSIFKVVFRPIGGGAVGIHSLFEGGLQNEVQNRNQFSMFAGY